MNADQETFVAANPIVRCACAAYVDPKLLRPHTSNPNRHPPKQIEMFITIINYQGWRRPITVSKRSNYITKGHGAHEAALAAGWTNVPVDYQDYEDEAQELADIVADNQLQRMSEMDTGKLTELMVSLDSGLFNLEMTGFQSSQIEQMFAALPGYKKDPENTLAVDYGDEDELPEPQYAEQSQASGGPAENEPHHDGMPPPQPVTHGHVRMIQLFFNETTVVEFMSLVELFQQKLEIDNATDTVMAVMRRAHAQEIGRPEE